MDCKTLFASVDGNSEKAKEIADAFPEANCFCENASVSENSPGIVTDRESLVRMIYSPHQIDPDTGQPNEAAFSDVKNKGLSVQRTPECSTDEIRAIALQKLAADHDVGKLDRAYEGWAVANVGHIRDIRTEDGNRAFCIYDTAGKNDRCHADVMESGSAPSKSKRKRLRVELWRLFRFEPDAVSKKL